MAILETIHSSRDVKKLREDQLEPLCREIRSFLIQSISRTGGHLASNLGTVELSIALHRVYDTEKDRLIFDVGHQSYTHKLLTGRRERFDSLRQYGGLSGFPKPREAVDDAFLAGHASNSVSVALGMAKARTLQAQDYDVVAVIGDGALTGGLAYEGLTGAAASGEPLVIILNDNNMSIDPNVGGLADMLQNMRVRPGYIRFKRWYRGVFRRFPALYLGNHKLKEWLKERLLPDNMFSAIGLNYMGPIDGHDVKTLETVIRWARDERKPVLVHVQTRKGKGCPYAEQHPERYHGVGPFDPVTGELLPSSPDFSETFGETICELAEEDSRLVAVTAAMAGGTGLESYAERYPQRFLDAGIAEGHATALIAGMAKQGLLPVFAVYSSFLQRGYDMLIHDVSLQQLHTVFCVDRAGLVGGDGETHHGIFDLAYLSSVPGMKIYCPSSFAELRQMLKLALYTEKGPAAIRYPRGGEGEYTACSLGDQVLAAPGADLTILCYGTMINTVLAAAEELREKGLSPEIVKVNRIGGETAVILDSLRKTRRLLAAEEVCAAGCLGQQTLSLAAQEGVTLLGAALLNLGEGIIPHGDRKLLMRDAGIDREAIVNKALELVRL